MNVASVPSAEIGTPAVPRLYLWPTAEQEFILTAAVGPDPSAIEAFKQWSAVTDFRENLDLGTFRLLPLVYRRMQALGVEATTMPMLKGVFRHAWCGTRALFHGVTPALSLLQSHKVEMLLLKGAPLLDGYYRGFGLRPMNDVDVVVKQADLRKAISLLEEAGWTRPSNLPDQYLEFNQSFEFKNSEGREIDLHSHVLQDACNESADAWFWSSSVPFEFMGIKTLQLDATGLLLHVVVHGIRPNRYPPFRWIADAITILAGTEQEIRWPELIAFARAQHLTHRLHLGFSYLVDRFDAPIPPFVLAELRAATISLTEKVENKFLLDTERTRSLAGKVGLTLALHMRISRDDGWLKFVTGILAHARMSLWLRLKLFLARTVA